MKPLEGIKVVDLTTYMATPATRRILGEWGAEVIKVEAAKGDPCRVTQAAVINMPMSDEENLAFDMVNLNKRFISLNLKSETGAAREIPRDLYTVPQKISYIRETVKEKEKVLFEELFDENAPKSEIVTTFQALLELLKHQLLIVTQDEIFSAITIMKNPNRNEEEEIGEIDEYN